MSGFYDDPRFGVSKQIGSLVLGVTCTSAGGAAATTPQGARTTVMEACKVTDFNVRIRTGQTNTSAQCFTFTVCKSLAGTGAITAIGTATAAAAIADGTVIDGSVTATSFSDGDDIVIQQTAGTILPASSIVVEGVEVFVKETFVAS